MEGFFLENDSHTPPMSQAPGMNTITESQGTGRNEPLSVRSRKSQGDYVVHEDGRKFRKVQVDGMEGTFLLDELNGNIYDENYVLV